MWQIFANNREMNLTCKMMRVFVLMENTSTKEGIQTEHGLSLYIETSKHRLLSDTGQSALTLENACKMGVDLESVDTVVISHGHYDHAGGLLSFASLNPKADIYMQRSAAGAFYHDERYIGIDKEILKLPGLHLLDSDQIIDEELSVFSGIRGRRLWPSGNRVLTEKIQGRDVQDTFGHEQCLVIKDQGKTVLLSGCAHNGILNILDRFRELYGEEPDVVISGFHMMKKSEYSPDEIRSIEETAKELAGYKPMFYTGHCTSQPVIDLMLDIMPDNLKPIHAGDILELWYNNTNVK